MLTLIKFIILGLAALMFVIKRPYKIAILLFVCTCFADVQIPFIPYIKQSLVILTFTCALSELLHYKEYIKAYKNKLVRNITWICIITIALLYITSPHYHDGKYTLRTLFLSDGEFINLYLAFILSYVCIRRENDINILLKVSLFALLLLTFFGILNFITSHSIFADYLAQDTNNFIYKDGGSKFTHRLRFRVQAMFLNPFNYGYICLLNLFFHIYGYRVKRENKTNFIIALFCCLFGIITCGCRSVLFSFVIGLFIYMNLAYKTSKRFKYTSVAVFAGIILYYSFPVIEAQVDNLLNLIISDKSVDGSSFELRAIQWAAVLNYIQGYELFGRGIGYYWYDIGWSKGAMVGYETGLYGLEGVHLLYLLERGIFGYALYWIYYICFIRYFNKIKKRDLLLRATGISICMMVLCFAHLTGILKSEFPTAIILAILAKIDTLKLQKSN